MIITWRSRPTIFRCSSRSRKQKIKIRYAETVEFYEYLHQWLPKPSRDRKDQAQGRPQLLAGCTVRSSSHKPWIYMVKMKLLKGYYWSQSCRTINKQELHRGIELLIRISLIPEKFAHPGIPLAAFLQPHASELWGTSGKPGALSTENANERFLGQIPHLPTQIGIYSVIYQ